jgi:EmrB/QacA subfamily drug resistance transporter
MNSNKNNKKESFFRKWGIVFVLSLALMIILIDATLLNVSLSKIIQDLNTDIQKLQWVITAYSLTLAALTIAGGRMGDLFGRKKMFITGAFLFAIGSFIASISQNVGTMIVGESIIEGVGAALMMPATASLLVSKYKGRDRGIAFGIWGGVAAASTAIGPILGGWLTTNYSWRWGFRINVFVAALLILGSKFITEYRDKSEKPKLDLPGVMLSSVGLFSLVFGIIESSTYGWIKAKEAFNFWGQTYDFGGYSVSLYALILGAIFLALFALWEKRQEARGNTPLVSLHLFKNKQFLSGMATTGIMSLGQSGLIFSIPVFMQAVRGENAFRTGLSLLPMSVMALVSAPIGGALSHKVAPKRLIQAGLTLNFLGYLLLYRNLNVNSVALDFAPALALMGMGMGLTMASISNITLSAVSPEQSGEASGVNNTFRQIGGTLGTAVIGAVLISSISANLSDGVKNSSVIPEKAKGAIAENVSKQTSNVEFGGGAKFNTPVPQNIKDEITKISHQSIADANKKTIKYAAIIALLGIISSLWLKGGVSIETEENLAKSKRKK